MPDSHRWGRMKTIALAVLLALVAGWALWVTTPKPELSSTVWDSPFSISYAERHRERVVTEVSESFELLNILVAVASPDNFKRAAEPETLQAFLPYVDHPAVSAVQAALEVSNLPELSGIFAYTLEDETLVRSLPHTLPAFDATLGPHKESLASFAAASGFQEYFARRRQEYDGLATELDLRVTPERLKAWLDDEFPAVSHDALRIIVSPNLAITSFSHNFSGPGFSEIVIFVPYPGSEGSPFPATVEGDNLESEVFAQAAGHYVSRMTDRYIRIVNRVFSNISVWRKGHLFDDPASIFNEYMKWSAYLLYARQYEPPGEFAKIVRRVVDRMNDHGYFQFEALWNHVERLHADRGEPLGALYPRIVREAIKIANTYVPAPD